MSANQMSRHEKDVSEVYNLLTKNYVENLPGMTRGEIEKELGKRFPNSRWYPIMKKVRELVVQNDLIVPTATPEYGHTYFITDNPDDVIPGMSADTRSMVAKQRKIIRDRQFIKHREGQLDKERNGTVYEAASVMADLSELMEKTMQISDQNLRESMDNRLEKSKSSEVV